MSIASIWRTATPTAWEREQWERERRRRDRDRERELAQGEREKQRYYERLQPPDPLEDPRYYQPLHPAESLCTWSDASISNASLFDPQSHRLPPVQQHPQQQQQFHHRGDPPPYQQMQALQLHDAVPAPLPPQNPASPPAERYPPRFVMPPYWTPAEGAPAPPPPLDQRERPSSSDGAGPSAQKPERRRKEPAAPPKPPPGYPKPLGPNKGLPAVRKGEYVFTRMRKLVISHGETLLSGGAVVRDAADNSSLFTLTAKLLSAHGRRTLHDAHTNLPLLTITSSKIVASGETMMVDDAFAAPGKEPLLTLQRVSLGIGKGKGVKCYAPRKRRDPVKDRNAFRKPAPPPPALFVTPRANGCTLRVVDAKSNHVADVIRNTASLRSIPTARTTYFINVSAGYDCALLAAACVCWNEQFS
jgi:hypothetical protein